MIINLEMIKIEMIKKVPFKKNFCLFTAKKEQKDVNNLIELVRENMIGWWLKVMFVIV